MAEIIGDLITDVQSRYSKGVRSTSSRLSNRMVYHKMKAIRGTLITQKANKKEIFSDSFYQLLEGIEMVSVTSSMLPTIPIGFPLMKSKYKIPSFIYSQDQPIIASLSNIENSKVYNKVQWQTIKNAVGRKYTGTQPNYFTLENDIFINERNTPKVTALRAVFSDPIEAQIYPIYNDENCNNINCTSYLELSFAVDKDMANIIVQMTAEELIKIYAARQEDRIQNSVDNTR